MKILIVGPGAMGCLFAARLSRAGIDTFLLDHDKKRAEEIAGQGIIVHDISGNYTVKVPIATEPQNPPDAILICVKSGKTNDAAESIKRIITEDTLVATLQNGLGNVEILEEILGKNKKITGGVTSEGATLLGTGKIRHAGAGDTVLGEKENTGDVISAIIDALNMAGFKASSSSRIDDLIWGKLIVNAGINALTAITGLKNGRLTEFRGSLNILKNAVNEAVAVSKAAGINLPYDDPVARVLEVCRATEHNIASMLQDVLNKRMTEVDFINGAICRAGEKSGIPTPVNRMLTDIVKTIESSYYERIV